MCYHNIWRFFMNEEEQEEKTQDLVAPTFEIPESESDRIRAIALAELSATRVRQAFKPDISYLEDAIIFDEDIDDVITYVQPGEDVIVQYPDPHRSTERLTLERIDYETGNMILWSALNRHYRWSNFKTALLHDHVMKIAPPRKRPFVLHPNESRNETRAFFEEALGIDSRDAAKKREEKAVAASSSAPKRRGRPPGSKNRDAETIAVEKAVMEAERAERRAVREEKKRIIAERRGILMLRCLNEERVGNSTFPTLSF